MIRTAIVSVTASFVLFGAWADVPVDLKTNEWTLLRDQFRALARNEGGREDSLEQFVDDGIRRHFGELISGACLGRRKHTFLRASENYYVELAQAQFLGRRVD